MNRTVIGGFVRCIRIICIALLGVLILSDVLFDQPQVKCDGHHYTCSHDQNAQPRWSFPETRSDAGDFWTAVASLVAIIVLAYMNDQLAVSREATFEARRQAV